MRRHFLCLAIALVVYSASSFSLSAAEPALEFVEGLRQRGYHNYAILYLDQLATKKNVPKEVLELITYEKAITYMQGARNLPSPDAQNKQLDMALKSLEDFVKASPAHPKAAQANTERARILLGKARVEVWQSRSPNNQAKKAELQTRGRGLVAQARKIFQAAHDQHEKTFKSFPVFIDKLKEKEQFLARRLAEVNYIRAQLDLALCTYEEAQTYAEKDPKFKAALNKAAKEFEEVHSRYRSQVGGLYARMWEGKCFEEQNDIRKALGIYNELLGHPGKSNAMRTLQAQVRHFRLICLNHDDRKDYQLVIQESDEWLTGNRKLQRTATGIGIRWEKVRAQDLLSDQREIPTRDKERLLRQALADANLVNRFPGQFKDVSTFMISQLRGKLGRGDQDPEDFETAIGIARADMKKIKSLQDDLKTAKTKEEKTKINQELKNVLTETARLLKLALTLADNDTELENVNDARYRLSYIYYLSRKSYESAILGEFVARHGGKKQSQLSLDGAYLALAAYVQAYNDSPKKYKDVDMAMMARTANLITSNWPESDTANEARVILGQIYSQLKKPVEAGEWYSQVPATAAQYARAQTAAGQAYWNGYLNASIMLEDQRPAPEELMKWQGSAEKHLRTGLQKTATTLPSTGAAPDVFIAAKLSLTQILLNKSQYQGAIDLLTKEPHSIMKAIDVAAGTKRPTSGVKSPEITSLAYQLLLRGYVGTQKIDEARATMNQLEAVAKEYGGDSGGAAITEIYKNLGEKISEEMASLKAAGNQKQLAEVQTSLETFLADLGKRKDQTFGSLIWMSETYYGLGQGSDDPTKSSTYFGNAATTYQSILARNQESKELNDQQQAGIKLRLVNCKRREGDFVNAEKLIFEILKVQPKALDAQEEAAQVYQDWAGNGQADSYKMYPIAMNGKNAGSTKEPHIWGWTYLANLLQRNLDVGRGGKDYEEKLLNATYNSIVCRHKLALEHSGKQAREDELGLAKSRIETFAAISGEVDDIWWNKFDKLYRQVLTDLGEAPVPLEKREEVAIVQNTEKPVEQDPTAVAEVAPVAAKSGSGGGGEMIAYIVVTVIFIGGIFVGLRFMSAGKKNRSYVAEAASMPTFIPPQPQQARKKVVGSAAGQSGQPVRRKKKVAKKKAAPGSANPAAAAPEAGQAQAAAGQVRRKKVVKKKAPPSGDAPPQRPKPDQP